MPRDTSTTKARSPKKPTDAAQRFEYARRALMRKDPRLAEVIKRVGRQRPDLSGQRDPFASLVNAIISQQLSGKAAATIHGRLLKLVGGAEALSPATLLAVPPDDLRVAGVSWPKISYLRDLAERTADGRLDLASLAAKTDDEIIVAITEVKGLGRWSAEMFLMFCLRRGDVFPVGDLGIVKGVQRLHGMKKRPKPRTMQRLAEPWRPHRSIACWYLWRLLE